MAKKDGDSVFTDSKSDENTEFSGEGPEISISDSKNSIDGAEIFNADAECCVPQSPGDDAGCSIEVAANSSANSFEFNSNFNEGCFVFGLSSTTLFGGNFGAGNISDTTIPCVNKSNATSSEAGSAIASNVKSSDGIGENQSRVSFSNDEEDNKSEDSTSGSVGATGIGPNSSDGAKFDKLTVCSPNGASSGAYSSDWIGNLKRGATFAKGVASITEEDNTYSDDIVTNKSRIISSENIFCEKSVPVCANEPNTKLSVPVNSKKLGTTLSHDDSVNESGAPSSAAVSAIKLQKGVAQTITTPTLTKPLCTITPIEESNSTNALHSRPPSSSDLSPTVTSHMAVHSPKRVSCEKSTAQPIQNSKRSSRSFRGRRGARHSGVVQKPNQGQAQQSHSTMQTAMDDKTVAGNVEKVKSSNNFSQIVQMDLTTDEQETQRFLAEGNGSWDEKDTVILRDSEHSKQKVFYCSVRTQTEDSSVSSYSRMKDKKNEETANEESSLHLQSLAGESETIEETGSITNVGNDNCEVETMANKNDADRISNEIDVGAKNFIDFQRETAKQLADLKEETREVKKWNERIFDERERLTRELTENSNELKVLRTKIISSEKENLINERLFADLSLENKLLQRENAQAREIVENLKENKTDLEENLKIMREEMEKSKEMIQIMMNLQEENSQFKTKIEKLQVSLSQSDDSIKSLREENSELKESMATLQEDKAMIQIRVQTLQEELSRSEETNGILISNNAQSDKLVNSLQEEILQLRNTVAELQGRLYLAEYLYDFNRRLFNSK